MSTAQYVVQNSDEHTITLRRQGAPSALGTVTIQRAAIASTRTVLGISHVETSGGHVYKVLGGFRAEQQAKTADALGTSSQAARAADLKARRAEVKRHAKIARGARKEQRKADRAARKLAKHVATM